MKNQAFTLIELLVVVLIIGILAAIAVPQYQKAIWKSRSRHMLVAIKALKDASQAYYLAHNEYPSKFSDLDITFSGYDKACTLDFADKTDCIANDYSELIINSYHTLFGGFPSGPYKGSSFRVSQEAGGAILNKISCFHYTPWGTKNMCTEIFNCTLEFGEGGNNYYSCSDL